MPRIPVLVVTAILLWFGITLLGAWLGAMYTNLPCPDWPTCYGQWMPLPSDIPADAGYDYFEVMMEWTHRLAFYLILLPLIIIICRYKSTRNKHDTPDSKTLELVILAMIIINLISNGYILLYPEIYIFSSSLMFFVLLLNYEKNFKEKPSISSSVLKFVKNSPFLLDHMKNIVIFSFYVVFIAVIAYSPSMNVQFTNIFDMTQIFSFSYAFAAVTLILFIWHSRREPALRALSFLALSFLLVQVGLEVFTAISRTPTALKVLHQANAILLSATISWLYVRLTLSGTNFVYSGQGASSSPSTTT